MTGLKDIRIEWQVFPREGAVAIGAVRQVRLATLLIDIEGYGDVEIGPEQIDHVDEGKVILRLDKLDEDLRNAVARAHRRETR